MEYLKDPQSIYTLSAQCVQEAVSAYWLEQEHIAGTALPSVLPPLSPALIRMVHACADPSIAIDFRASLNAESIGANALAQGAPILCDCEMVRHGVVKSRLPTQNSVLCHLNDMKTPLLAEEHQTTRSAAAVYQWLDNLHNSIVLIGNAPTALFQLLELLIQGAPKPALIIGMPVGFVGAAESKQALIDTIHHKNMNIAYLTLLGRKGGSAIAAAALNSLAGSLGS